MGLILNIETSSENCSVAIARNGEMVATLESTESKSHATILTVLIEKILQDNAIKVNNLDAIAVSKGPGSYTGLRIGVSVAKGLCYGAGKPLIAINTLESMLNGLKMSLPDFDQAFAEDAIFCPMLDARRQEVYLAHFSKGGETLHETAAEIIHEESFKEILESSKLIFFGSGADKIKTVIAHPNALFIEGFAPRAEYLAALSESAFRNEKFEDVAYFEPLYLKDFVATIPKRKVF